MDHNQNQNPCHPQPNVAQSPEIIRSTLTFANLCIRWERSQARTSIHTDTHRQTRSRTHASYPEPNQSTIYTHTHLNPTPTQCTSALARTHQGACTHSHVHACIALDQSTIHTHTHVSTSNQPASHPVRNIASLPFHTTKIPQFTCTHSRTNTQTSSRTHPRTLSGRRETSERGECLRMRHA